MNIRLRLFLAFFIFSGAGLYYVFHVILNDVRPRYFEALEESMNDTVNMLAVLLEQKSTDEGLPLENISALAERLYSRKLNAKIYEHTKSEVDLGFYVCDGNGTVIFDSKNGGRTGQDYSQWNDVYLALQGKYGARSTTSESNIDGTLYVAAPVRRDGKIIGTVTVEKSKSSVSAFISLLRRRIIILGVASFLIFTAVSIVLSFWITSPVRRLTVFINSLQQNKRAVPPRFSGKEINDLAAAFEKVITELDGKKYIEEYVSTLAHEIKSPLTSIRSAAELMTEDLPPEQKRKFLENILREGGRINELIEKMLLLSSVENREGLRTVEKISPKELLEDVSSSLAPQAESAGVNIVTQCGDNTHFEGEYFLVRHSLLNLADNAVKHSHSGSGVVIQALTCTGKIVLRVTDNGRGIPEYARAKVFDRFYSASSGASGRGTGLGLSFVRAAVELHGGRVSIEDNPDGGTIAGMEFPLFRNSAGPAC